MIKSLSSSDSNSNFGSRNQEKQKRPVDVLSSPMIGKHCILEAYGCNQKKLDDEGFIRTMLIAASQNAGATLLNMITHKFSPLGVTGLALLSESHISIHTWPESGYAAIDVFTCGNKTNPEKACKLMAKELSSTKYSLKTISRETKINLCA